MNNAEFPLFLSTAIPYVNGAPHVGHAFELLLADALSRHARQRRRDVRFTGGTDDHSAKNARAALARGLPTATLVNAHGDVFRRLPESLGVRLDDYLHTSRDARHAPAVRALWERCLATGDLYQRDYEGLYCTGCEAFLAPTELVDGKCAVHGVAAELVAEKNWFFRLSRYQAPLLAALESGALRIQPRERANEVLSFVRSGLVDFSVSRSRARAHDWGITVPNDESQVIYVWFDALANYLSLLGFPSAHSPSLCRFWLTPGGAREHVIGKDILRFHAVYWPAILLSAGLPLPTCVRTHGFVTLSGDKLSKSSGRLLDPFELVDTYGQAAVRFYCLRHLHTTKDSDFDVERLQQAHDSELAGKLGNLLQRTVTLALRYPDLTVRRDDAAESDADRELRGAAEHAATEVARACDDFALHQALGSIFELVSAANRYADAQEPWTLSRKLLSAKSPEIAADLRAQLAHVLWRLCAALRVTAILLAPFLPQSARELANRLGTPFEKLSDWQSLDFDAQRLYQPQHGAPLFPRKGRALATTTSP
jgi:methionyl-tRNA synthetase